MLSITTFTITFTLVTSLPISWPLLSVTSDPAITLASNHFGICAMSSISQTCAFVGARGGGGASGAAYAISRIDANSPFSNPPIDLQIDTATFKEAGA